MTGHKPSVLITGGSGNLGSWMTNYLLESDEYEITVLSRTGKPASPPDKPCKQLVCDVTDFEQLKETLQPFHFDFIIHLASCNDSFENAYAQRSLQINALGTRNLLECLKQKPVKKFIYFSTFHVYGKSSGFISESDPVQPRNDYAITHYFAEKYVEMFHQNEGLPYLIFRLSNSYGCPVSISAGKWYLLFNDLCRSAFFHHRITLNSNGRALRDFIYMGDVCRLTEKAMHHTEKNQIFNLGSGQSHTVQQIAEWVQQAWQEYSGTTIPILLNRNDATDYGKELIFSTQKLQKHFGKYQTQAFVQEAKKIFQLLQNAEHS